MKHGKWLGRRWRNTRRYLKKEKSVAKEKSVVKAKIEPLQHNEELAQIVLETLGKPNSLANIKATNLFDDWYRVNVRVVKEEKEMLAITTISDSFFVRFSKGKIVGGDEIIKKY
jgi:hypothetical protein